jgi:hypothetical protein
MKKFSLASLVASLFLAGHVSAGIPNNLTYSTYFGGTASPYPRAIAIGQDGSMYIAGYVRSGDFPTLNAIDNTFGGVEEAFVCKFAASGQLAWSTFLGGSSYEEAYAIALDSDDNVYVAGQTMSTDFPLVNALDSVPDDYSGDCFVSKISPDGSTLIFSTFLGGNSVDHAYALSVGGDGRVYVGGATASTDFPTPNGLYTSRNNMYDCFFAVMTATGDSLLYGTYLGGSNTDEVFGLAVGIDGRVAVAGRTYSADFVTESAYDPTYSDSTEAFVAVFTESTGPNGGLYYTLEFSTYMGGTEYDAATGVALGVDNSVYVGGDTDSDDFPTSNAYDDTLGAYKDAFVAKFTASGSLVYSTYLGGRANREYCQGIKVDELERVCVAGHTSSSDFPLVDAWDDSYNLSHDAFVTVFQADGSALEYSTYVGGHGYDQVLAMTIDKFGAIYVTGNTSSTDFPMANPWDSTNDATAGGFLFRMAESCCDADGLSGNVDGDSNALIDIGDLTALISYLYIPPNPPPACMDEGNLDGDVDGLVDIGDLTALISYLYIPPNPLPALCP